MQLIDRLTGGARQARDEGRRRADDLRDRLAPRPSPWGGIVLAALGAIAGALAAFFLDPDRGRSRRARYGDQAAGLLRRGLGGAERAGRIVGSTAEGKLSALRNANNGDRDLNDAELAHAIETELFRDPSVPKGQINVNVERGIAVLRGEVGTSAERDALAKRVARMPGVWSVRNLLHVPGEPAPAEDLVRS
jgi:hypothetical protein